MNLQIPESQAPAPSSDKAAAPAPRRVSRKVAYAVAAGILAAVAVVVHFLPTPANSTLNLICRHNMRSAELTVIVDGKLVLTQEISAVVKKRFGVLEKRSEASFSKALKLPAGEHVMQVRLVSAADTYDQSHRLGINLPAQKEATVAIGAQRASLSVIYQGPPVAPSSDTGEYFAYIRSVLVTVLGSAVSALIGFTVQEFLKSRKAPQA